MARGEAITKTVPCTYERVLKLMSPCHGVVKGTDVNSQLMQAASAPYALHLG